ncbi:MAG: heparinase II/III family protein, partial [Clostridia bacterium]
MKRFISAIVSLAMIISVFMAFPAVINAASMADATFFAKFDYAANPGLAQVKSYVDSGDYDNAKAALLQYFKDRKQTSTISGFGITEADEFYGMAVLPMRNILTGPYEFDMWQGEFTVTSSSYADYEVDVTDRIASELNNGAASFMLFAGDKQQYPVYVKSKEAGSDVAPKLVITYDIDGTENTVTVTADNDTYISSGNTSTTYGSETVLNIKEDGSGSDSTGSNTRRTYINFPLTEAANSTIIAAKLVLNAAYAADCTTGDKDVLVINVGDTMWSEDSLTWAGTRGSIYSYQDAQSPTWNASAPNCDGEYHNVTSRFWFGKPMAYEYLSYLEDPDLYNATHPYSDVYPGEEFGPKLVELMDAFATQMSYGYTRTLETGERLNRWVDIVDALLETDVFDTRLDEFCNIISFMWGDCNYLNSLSITNGSVWWSNWRIVANAGFFKAVEYFPEFLTHDTWREKVEYNVEYTFDLLYNDDYSFTEAGPSYAAWCVKLFGDCLRAAKMSGNPMSAVFTEKVKYAARNALESYYPNGYDTNIGDSNYRDQKYYFEMLNEVFGASDAVINSYASGTDKGAEYLTHYYSSTNSAYMRNSWNPSEAVYVNFTNNPADGHYHPDSNQVIMYAYGSPLLVDSGRYSYSSTNSIYNTLRTAASHNTIEAEGLTLGAHSASASANSLTYANSNDIFDFASSEQHGYTNVSHTRNVFFARKGFSIVTDYVAGDTSRAYRQNWHFMPSSNATVSGTTAKTDFYNAPDVTVSAASADSASINDGYHSADYGLVAESKYASFEKTGTTVKFDTLLYPERADEEIEAAATDLAEDDTTKAAIKITVDGEEAYYYVRNTSDSDGTFGTYTTDAKMAYVSDTEYMIADGKTVSDKIESSATIISMGVTIDGGTVTISGEKLVANSDSATAIKIYAPDTTLVTLNGESVKFTQSGDYIYAVSSAVSESVTGATAKVYPDKDGFHSYASSTGNEGTSNTTIIQAAMSSWNNRNAYMAYDLSDFADKEITNVTLNMKMYENASAGNLHFYYLDYGTWTRSNLSFVLDSSKMPTHGTSSGAGFTGYAYRWQGSASGVAVNNWVQFTTNFPSYLAANNNYKFTWAMLSETGSAKFYALAADEANRPYLEVTYNYTISSEPDPTVTIKKYADGVLKSTSTETATLGSVYLYEAEETITENGTTYYIDPDMSNISTVVQKDGNVLEVYYKSAKEITVDFADIFGNTIADSVAVSVNSNITTYTYTAPNTITTADAIYTLDTSASKLTCAVKDGAELHAVYKKTATIGENLIYNGDMSETTTSSGYTYVTGWKGGYVNAVHYPLSTSPDLKNAGASGTTTDAHFIYTAPTDLEGAYVTTPLRSTMTSSSWGTYPWENDVSEPYMGLVLTSWMMDANDVNTYLKAEKGKTYYMAFDMKATSIASSSSINNVVGFTAVTEDGDVYANQIPGTNGDIQTLTSVLDNSIGRSRYLTTADEWVTVETTATANADGYFMFQLGWAYEWGQVSVGNFRIYEIAEFNYSNVTFDGNNVVTEGTIALGNETEESYTLPENVIGYSVISGDVTKFVPAGELDVADGDVITTVNINVSMVTGAQVRYGGGLDENGKVSDGNGLRFIAQVDRSRIGGEVTG